MKFLTQAEALKFINRAEAGLDRELTDEPQSPDASGVYAMFIVMLMSGLRVGTRCWRCAGPT
jgi:hypothetical protein